MVCPHAPSAAAPRPCLRADQVDELLNTFFSALHVDPSTALRRRDPATAAPASAAGAALAAAACAKALAAAATATAPSTPPRPQRKQDATAPPALLRRVALGHARPAGHRSVKKGSSNSTSHQRRPGSALLARRLLHLHAHAASQRAALAAPPAPTAAARRIFLVEDDKENASPDPASRP